MADDKFPPSFMLTRAPYDYYLVVVSTFKRREHEIAHLVYEVEYLPRYHTWKVYISTWLATELKFYLDGGYRISYPEVRHGER